MSRNSAVQTEESTPMSKWLVLPMIVLAYIATSATAAAPRDRDHDRLPDRWERSHHLSTAIPSAKRDPDSDRLTNRRELRIRTHPRHADSDRDRLRDGAEVRRFHSNPRKWDTDGDRLSDWREIRRLHTNPRKRDTDGDGFRDRCELRSGTNPRNRESRPMRRCSESPPEPPKNVTPTPAPAPAGGFPNPASTGVPAGWTPARTLSTNLTVTTAGAVVQDIRFTNGADILVRAPNVTVRRVDLQGGIITNQIGTCNAGLLVEDTTIEPQPGQAYTTDAGPVIGEGGYTARRVEIWKRGEGFRASDCGPVTIEDSFTYILGDTADCGLDLHSDGLQGYFGTGVIARNNTFIFGNKCGTSPWFVPRNQGNSGNYTVDRMLVAGGGYVFRQGVPASITGLRIVNRSWVYGPISNLCSVISPWEAKIVNIDSNYQVTGVVRDQPCNTQTGN
jgi:Bacterial TSP3 repeat